MHTTISVWHTHLHFFFLISLVLFVSEREWACYWWCCNQNNIYLLSILSVPSVRDTNSHSISSRAYAARRGYLQETTGCYFPCISKALPWKHCSKPAACTCQHVTVHMWTVCTFCLQLRVCMFVTHTHGNEKPQTLTNPKSSLHWIEHSLYYVPDECTHARPR